MNFQPLHILYTICNNCSKYTRKLFNGVLLKLPHRVINSTRRGRRHNKETNEQNLKIFWIQKKLFLKILHKISLHALIKNIPIMKINFTPPRTRDKFHNAIHNSLSLHHFNNFHSWNSINKFIFSILLWEIEHFVISIGGWKIQRYYFS